MAEGTEEGVSTPAGADDLDVLCPDRDLHLQGEQITVREYSFAQGLKLAPQLSLLTAALEQIASSDDSDDSLMEVAFAGEADAVLDLMAASCGKSRAWVEALPDDDGRALMFTWWLVNKDFFVRRLLLRQALSAGDRMADPDPDKDSAASSLH